MIKQNLSLRRFMDGDEPAIVALFNKVYSRYNGFVPRTVEYWHWCCLDRPDVHREGILLAFDTDRLRGYLVVGSSGNIWEFCVNDDEREVAKALLSEAVNYLEKMEVSSVSINIPRQSAIIKELHEAGFGEVPSLSMFVTTLNPSALVEALLKSQKEVLEKRLEGEFGFHLRDAPYGTSNEFCVKIHNSSIKIAEGCPLKPSVAVELKFMDFLSVLFRDWSTARLFLTGKIKIRPFWKSGAVLALMSAMRLKDPWFYPLGDSM